MRKLFKKGSKYCDTKTNRVYDLSTDGMYMQLQPGMKVYQNKSGEYLPDAQQPKPENPQCYLPHQGTRYKNIVMGSNGKAQAVRFSKEQNGVVPVLVDTDKQLPHLYDNRSECCGCAACYAICPVRGFLENEGKNSIGAAGEEYKLPRSAIYMEEDEEGFRYPVVDAALCIRCYKCINVCPVRNADKEKGIEFEIWGGRKQPMRMEFMDDLGV